MLVFALISYRLAKARGYIVLGATATMILVIATFLPDAFYQRIASIVPSMTYQEETVGTRVELWKAGIKMVGDHPILGVGPGNFGKVLARYGQGMDLRRHEIAPHSSYVGVAAEGGIPALVLYLLLCGAAIREAFLAARAARRGVDNLALEALAMELCIVVLLITGLSVSFERHKYMYIFFGIVLSLKRLAVQAPLAEASPAVLDRAVARGRGVLEAATPR
jgi:O-antigen ligase